MRQRHATCVIGWVAAVLCGGFPCDAASPLQPRITLPCKVVRVVDGDTIDVELAIVVRLRLLADGGELWAPETRTRDAAEKRLGLESKRHLESIALGQRGLVDVPITSNRLIDYMTMERILGDVHVGGESLGRRQIDTGHASTRKGGALGE